MPKKIKPIVWGAVMAIALVSLYFTVIFSFWFSYKNRIYPGVSVAGINLSGKTKEEATQALNEKIGAAPEVSMDGTKITDINIKYQVAKTVEKALLVGQKNPFILGFKTELPIDFDYSQDNLYKALSNKERKISSATIESRVVPKEELDVKEGKPGVRLNFSETSYNFKNAVENLRPSFSSSTYAVNPTFFAADLTAKKEEIQKKVPESITLIANEKTFTANKAEIISWTKLRGERLSYAKMFYGEPFMEPIFGASSDGLYNNQLVENYLLDIANKINTTPVNAVLSVQEGKVIVATLEINGQQLDIVLSAQNIINSLESKSVESELEIKVQKAEIRSDNLTELGLVELVSTGSSNFTGSPVNRTHNIKTGASKFNGVLVKPNEEFSFNTILGPVDASTGYLPELVILENKTQPQFGGGLCQVSSTAFRAALNAGLPITARKAHAYPVKYYLPYGVDATIYLPNPDLKFKNDTGKYLFMQTRIVGKNLYFDFYGTKPNRTITFSGNENGSGAVYPVEKVTPFIYDQGVRGNGSFTAVFHRFITDSNGKTTTAKWVSKYDSPDKYPH